VNRIVTLDGAQYSCAVRRLSILFTSLNLVANFSKIVLVQLSDKTCKVVMLEVFWKDVFRELLDL
jgi:hypothetical protein